MGYFLGEKMPEYNPFWEEPEYEDKPDWWKWYHFGYDDGYGSGSNYRGEDLDTIDSLRDKIESLENLLSANIRVIKDELRKEIDQEIKTPDE